MKHSPLSIKELKEQRLPIKNNHAEHKSKLTKTERFAVMITRHIGTMGFFFLIVAWTLFWFFWNTLTPAKVRFDPFPAFVLWLFISNIIQLILLPLLMVGQNLQDRHAEIRAKNDYYINLKSEKEVETILQHLENQNEAISEIINQLKNSKNKK